MKVLVTGSRDFDDRDHLFAVLDAFNVEVLVEGCSRGADRLAEEWATKRGVRILHNPADWGQHGRAAGAIRNRQMLAQHKPDVVIAFPADRHSLSPGTADMVKVARKADLPVMVMWS